MLSTILDLTGAGLVVYGVAMVSTPAAFVLAGLLVLAVSWIQPWRADS